MNVVLIYCDQLSAKYLGCYGDPAAATPNIDALARRGVGFDNFIADCPVCMPARAGTITGLAVRRHGVYCNGYELGAELPTFPRRLQAAGVRTAGFGKFHLQCHARGAYNDVRQYGFDEAATTEDIRAGAWLDWVKAARPGAYEQAVATVWPTPHLRSYGSDKIDLLAEADAARKRLGPDAGPYARHGAYESRIPADATQTFWVGQKAVDFLSRQKPGRPFFLYASFVSPHDPYDPPAGYLERIDPAAVAPPLPPTWRDDSAPPRLFGESWILRRFDGLDEGGWRGVRRHYLASMAEIDDQVGRIVAAVEAAALSGETVILFTADHGDMLGDHGLVYKGGWHYDACIRVPFIAAGAGAPGGRRVAAPAADLDVCPTVLELFGADCPWEHAGRSLAGVIAGGDADEGRGVTSESFATYAVQEPYCHTRTMRTLRYRFSRHGDGAEQLFDLAADPDEMVNLAGSPAHADICRQLRRPLLAALPEQEYPLPTAGRLEGATH